MVVSRRATLTALVATAALVVSAAFLLRFEEDHGIVSFLLGCALLVVGLVHAIAWRESRKAMLIADLTGLQVRLGGSYVALPWSEVEFVGVASRGRLGDGRLTVHPRDELRALTGGSLRRRFAVLLNRWLYDNALVVPYGLATKVSVADIPATLERLADGRADVILVDEREAEPEPTVNIEEPVAEEPHPDPEAAAGPPAPRRLAVIVSALRSPAGRRGEVAPVHFEPATAGTLALADESLAPTLPEVEELRRQPPDFETPLRQGIAAAALAPLEHSDLPAAAAIGQRLREAREWLGLSVDALADRTRIRPVVIEAIEVGDFSICGGDFYARGHLRMLSGMLGIETEPILRLYDERIASGPISPRAVFDADLSRGVVRPAGNGSRWGALIGTVVVLILVWAGVKIFFGDSGDASGQSGSAALQQTSHQSGGVADRPAITDPSIGNELPPPAAPLHLTIAASGASRVVVRDASMKIIYVGTLQAGQTAGIAGQPPLRVMASNAGAVTLTAAGHPSKVMGEPGQRAFRRIS
jgi:cytoskeletal protein RodZ